MRNATIKELEFGALFFYSIFKVNSTPVHPKVEFTLENHRSGIYFDRKTK